MPSDPRSRPATPLSRERILETAIQLVDAHGAQALTMRSLAAELDVEAMSLYNHVSNKQDILDGMASVLIARMLPWDAWRSLTPQDWESALRSVCTAYRSTITAHPHVFASQAGRPLISGEDTHALQQLLSIFREAGFDEAASTDLFQAGANMARGFAMTDISRVPSEDPTPEWNRDRAFDRSISALIHGFRLYLSGKTVAPEGA